MPLCHSRQTPTISLLDILSKQTGLKLYLFWLGLLLVSSAYIVPHPQIFYSMITTSHV